MSVAFGPITTISIGVTDPQSVVQFFESVGFVEAHSRDDRRIVCARSSAGEQAGAAIIIRQVAPELDYVTFDGLSGYTCGPRAIDLYTDDLSVALNELRSSGAPIGSIGEVAEISLGPVTMRQCMLTGPSGVQVVLVQSTHRRRSLLDSEPGRRFSEPHSVVWCVPSISAETEWWVLAGATKGMDLLFEEPSLSPYLGLDRPVVPVAMVMLSNVDVSATRLELLSFPNDAQPAGPLPTKGILGIGFASVPSIELDAENRTPGGIVIHPSRSQGQTQ